MNRDANGLVGCVLMLAEVPLDEVVVRVIGTVRALPLTMFSEVGRLQPGPAVTTGATVQPKLSVPLAEAPGTTTRLKWAD